MLGTAFRPEIEELIEQRNFSALRDALLELRPVDIADVLKDVPMEDQAVIFRLLPTAIAADVFERMEPLEQQALLRSLGQKQVAKILNEMTPDDRTALLEDLPQPVAQRLLGELSPEEYRIAAQLLAYPPQSVGRRMTTEFVAIRSEWTIAEVLEHLRTNGKDLETMDILYVTDASGHLLDDIRLREVVLADPKAKVSDLLNQQVVFLSALDDQESAVREFQRSGHVALPVVDQQNILVGIITADDLLKIAQTESTEDLLKLGGAESLGGPYLQVSLLHMVRRRAGWLCALFLGEMLTATAMSFYQKEIASAVVLALFIPLVISSGGNSGSQATTLIIRAMALGHLKLSDWWRVARRELLAGLMLGSILGSIAFLRIMLWPTRAQVYGPHFTMVAFTVGTALVGVVMFGTTMGSLLPFILRRLGFDPAVSSAPFVATLVDVTGLIIYFTVASIILRGLLL